jgi:hypothetical protein
VFSKVEFEAIAPPAPFIDVQTAKSSTMYQQLNKIFRNKKKKKKKKNWSLIKPDKTKIKIIRRQ